MITHKEIRTKFGTNPEIIDLLVKQLFRPEGVLIKNLHPGRLHELFPALKLILKPEIIALYNFFHYYKAATPGVIRKILGLPKTTLHRALELMVELGLIVRVEKAEKAEGRPGPKSVIYAMKGYTEEDIHRARKLERMRTTRFLHSVIEGYRLTWKRDLIKEDGEKRRVYIWELIALVKQNRLSSNFAAYDIAREIGQLLRLDGVEVIW